MIEHTPQELGYLWESQVAKLFGGQLQRGSGNRCYARLDVTGRNIIVSAKHTTHGSFSLSRAIFDDAVSAVQGPAAADPTLTPIIATKLGDGTMIASLELMELISWVREPPQVVPATPQENLRRTARTPNILRS